MDSEQRRKRKRFGRPYNYLYDLSFKSLLLLLSFVFLFLLVSHRLPLSPGSFRPIIGTHLLYSSAKYSLVDDGKRQSSLPSFSSPAVGDLVVFPDQVLLFSSDNATLRPDGLDCVFRATPQLGFYVRPVLSSDRYGQSRFFARCPLPPGNFSGVDLRRLGGGVSLGNRTAAVKRWDRLVYEAEIDGDAAVVFVKGMNLRAHQKADPSQFRCRFGPDSQGLVLTTTAIAAAQEVVVCPLPESIKSNPGNDEGTRVTVSRFREIMPSVARLYGVGSEMKPTEKHELCACTMVWNQASAIKEWITYHAWLGVERWFVYDNNSDDGIEDVVRELDGQGFNVTRRAWPWIKTQEAGFSHCALRAKDKCKWVGFFDVDEYFYLPRAFRRRHRLGGHGFSGQNALRGLVTNFSTSDIIGEIRTTCHSFGPSGLSSPPPNGVTVGYTCRLQSPERHKSIVRPELIDVTLLNAVHHFKLREGFRYLNVPENTALVNHYKYQVWEVFQTKFFRRVSTYVVDWQEDQNKGSKDRAPGLGTEPIEPPNWRLQFCEVRDTRLRDFVLANFVDPATGLLPWEDRSQAQL